MNEDRTVIEAGHQDVQEPVGVYVREHDALGIMASSERGTLGECPVTSADENLNDARIGSGYHDVGNGVPSDVVHGERVEGPAVEFSESRIAKTSSVRAKENRDGRGIEAAEDSIRPPIPVQVGESERPCGGSGRIVGGDKEPSGAVTTHHG